MLRFLESRRVQSAIIGGIVAVLVHFIPSLESTASDITNVVGLIVVALITGFTADHVSYNLTNSGVTEITVEEEPETAYPKTEA